MLTELVTTALVLGLPVLLLTEEIARLIPVRVKVERTLLARRPQGARATTQQVRIA